MESSKLFQIYFEQKKTIMIILHIINYVATNNNNIFYCLHIDNSHKINKATLEIIASQSVSTGNLTLIERDNW